MNEKLPLGFIEQLAPLLGSELPSFVASYEEEACRGLRMRPGFTKPEDAQEKVLWAENAFRVPFESTDGALIAHEAGAYYMQEPSAMAAAAALKPLPGERVLDLCAAPGGKSTQLAAYMQGEGVLVCNEPHPARVQILSRNVERMGIANAVVVSSLPEKLCKKWEGFFDKVLVDAPCSGEGMFRRHPESRTEWDVTSPVRCAERQKQILSCAAMMLRRGGEMVYSTCTFNEHENEGVILHFLREHEDFELVPFELTGIGDCDGMLRVWPHRVRGEGHFVAKLRRKGNAVLPEGEKQPLPERNVLGAVRDFFRDAGMHVPGEICTFGTQLVCPPVSVPFLRGVKVLRLGLHLGQMKGKVFAPDHAPALALKSEKCVDVQEQDALKYLHGETLQCEESLRGWVIVRFDGMQLGWGKASDGQIKNHYPKGLRK
ncbi:MAG: RsmF rRNA methyltransferase first C-terminal domain-containing protein [Clostridia bacterium]|nr:RsmF rRNA methyltransferase first C-terminal domain-containing protein [Clostridia bacterium]